MKKIKSKKKLVLTLLLVLTVVGVVGYGVYSYYYASGSVTHTGTIDVDGFDVTIYDDNNDYEFINGSHESSLICVYSSGETFECTSEVVVSNNGSNTVSIDIDNLEATVSGIDGASVTSVSTDWSNNTDTISSGDNSSYIITAEVEIPGYVAPSDDATEVSSPITGGQLTVTATYDITATEVH